MQPLQILAPDMTTKIQLSENQNCSYCQSEILNEEYKDRFMGVLIKIQSTSQDVSKKCLL